MASPFWSNTIHKLTLGLLPAAFKFISSIFSGGKTKDAVNQLAKDASPVIEETATDVLKETIRKNTPK